MEEVAVMLPREKATQFGVGALTDQELIALMLGGGSRYQSVFQIAEAIINQYHFLPNLQYAGLAELSRIAGVGPAKALMLAGGIELGRRVAHQLGDRFGRIDSVESAAQHLMDYYAGCTQEEFIAIYLDAKNAVIAEQMLFKGSLTASIAHPREVFAGALRFAAAHILVAHNHPSGDPTPSQQDLMLTERLVSVGEIVGIEVVDHLIVGQDDYVSIRSCHPW
ncbi:MAG: DNA repair protein RadC [Schleiferilactobacillus harbinensis]|jgi:DNA repair protein RadC|nr:DNA repair protein RadC [Schleiferilactobacillus harbinensis]MCI1913332.1 DNA repair protein RadC [Schleiferilactobacillus harbinensis]